MNKKRILHVLLGAVLLCSLCGCGSPLSGREKQVLETINLETDTAESTPEKSLSEENVCEEPESQPERKVYVCGAVNNPGVYSFTEGDRRADALLSAGGATEEAALDAVNLAQPLQDGEMIRIPTKEEVLTGTVSAAEESADDGKININTADASQLQTLPGVGESRALQIIAYREENGPFGKPEDIMNVSGIKEGLYAKLKDHIKVGG